MKMTGPSESCSSPRTRKAKENMMQTDPYEKKIKKNNWKMSLADDEKFSPIKYFTDTINTFQHGFSHRTKQTLLTLWLFSIVKQ